MHLPATSRLLFLSATIASISTVNAFFGGLVKTTPSRSKVSPVILDEAVEIYLKRFPKKSSRKRLFFEDWGVPKRDIDGSVVGTIGKGGSPKGKSLFDIDESRQRTAFVELAKLYGESEALEMTKILPNILAFDYSSFDGALAAFSELFGEDEAKEMVIRNPSLLAVNPTTAATSDDQTMQFSYIVSATRPIGKAGLPSILALLSIPALEQITQFPIRAQLLSSLTGGNTAEVASNIQQFSNSLPLMN